VGNVYTTEEDVKFAGAGAIAFRRFYNSADVTGVDGVVGWRHSYDRSITTVYQNLALMPVRAESHPCERETEALMTTQTSWQKLSRAAAALPPKCFSGYFAEGISDALVGKMGKDWAGFIRTISHESEGDKFFALILKSINSTLNPDDIQAINKLALKSCPATIERRCNAIAHQAKAALANYHPPIVAEP
jgi:hypothetical protein